MPDPTTTTDRRVYEARIARATAPDHYRLARWRRWRWSVTRYGQTDPVNPGVYDGRIHLWSGCGYTFTWLGAAFALADEVTVRRTLTGEDPTDV